RETGAAVVLVHHVKKGEGEGQDMLLGSGQFQATPDNIVVWSSAPKGAEKGCKTLTWIGRDLPSIEPEVIKLDVETLQWERVGSASEIKAETKQEKDALTAQTLKEALLGEENGLSVAQLVTVTGFQRNAVS